MEIRNFEKPDEFLELCTQMLANYDALHLRHLKGDYPSEEEIEELQSSLTKIRERLGLLESMTNLLIEEKKYDFSDFFSYVTDVVYEQGESKVRFKYKSKLVEMTWRQLLSRSSFQKKFFEHTGETAPVFDKKAYNRIPHWFAELATLPTEPSNEDIETVRKRLIEYLPENIMDDIYIGKTLLCGVISETIDGEQYFLFAREQCFDYPNDFRIADKRDCNAIFKILGVKFQGFWNFCGQRKAVYRVKMNDLQSFSIN